MSNLRRSLAFSVIGIMVAGGLHSSGSSSAWDFSDPWVKEDFLFKVAILVPMFTAIPWVWFVVKSVGLRAKEKVTLKRMLELRQLHDAGVYTKEEFEAEVAKLKGA